MEPVQIGRGDGSRVDWADSKGLPQWSPSRSDGVTEIAEFRALRAEKPQWSPSRSDGVTGIDHRVWRPADWAAMEPVQIGRGDSSRVIRGMSSWAGRNGARPDRTG